MLEHLDTVIAFATVMLLLSLLVTTIVQMVIALWACEASVCWTAPSSSSSSSLPASETRPVRSRKKC